MLYKNQNVTVNDYYCFQLMFHRPCMLQLHRVMTHRSEPLGCQEVFLDQHSFRSSYHCIKLIISFTYLYAQLLFKLPIFPQLPRLQEKRYQWKSETNLKVSWPPHSGHGSNAPNAIASLTLSSS